MKALHANLTLNETTICTSRPRSQPRLTQLPLNPDLRAGTTGAGFASLKSRGSQALVPVASLDSRPWTPAPSPALPVSLSPGSPSGLQAHTRQGLKQVQVAQGLCGAPHQPRRPACTRRRKGALAPNPRPRALLYGRGPALVVQQGARPPAWARREPAGSRSPSRRRRVR